MSEDRIYAALMEISEKLGTLHASQENANKQIDCICKRLDAVEQKPAKRLEGGIRSAINSIVSATIGAIVAYFFKH